MHPRCLIFPIILFFNISGNFTKSVEDQQLWVDADRFTPYDDKKCVTGEYLPVAGTPLDFRMPHAIGECIDADHPQLKVVNGYDHTWELNTKGDDTRLHKQNFFPGRHREFS